MASLHEGFAALAQKVVFQVFPIKRLVLVWLVKVVQAGKTSTSQLQFFSFSSLLVSQNSFVSCFSFSFFLLFTKFFVLFSPLLFLENQECIFCSVKVQPKSPHHMIYLKYGCEAYDNQALIILWHTSYWYWSVTSLSNSWFPPILPSSTYYQHGNKLELRNMNW